jgi:hypothetical protein
MNTLYYILVFIALIYIAFRLKMLFGHKKVIGRRVRVNYFDQNYHFETIFPLKGIVTKVIKIKDNDFFLIKLDKSFTYESVDYDTIAVRERAVGQALGVDKETDVHVLLPKVTLDKEQYAFDEFYHVVWATVETL